MKQLKVLDLYNHAPVTVKLLTKIGAIPFNWIRWHEIYRDYLNYGVKRTTSIHNCSSRECYRAKEVMQSTIILDKLDNEKIHDELQGLIELFT